MENEIVPDIEQVEQVEQAITDIENQLTPPSIINPLSLGRQVCIVFCVFVITPPVVITLIYVYIWLGTQAGII